MSPSKEATSDQDGLNARIFDDGRHKKRLAILMTEVSRHTIKGRFLGASLDINETFKRKKPQSTRRKKTFVALGGAPV